ncbi:MAG TPA: SagB/ThcOx family dehydrogenase [Burkholderiaceae bacterium]
MLTRREITAGLLGATVMSALPSFGASLRRVPLEPLNLPKPVTEGGMPLFSALKLRRSMRSYSNRPIPLPLLSNLLWAAFGVNRPDGGRTAPSWHGVMAIDIYLAMANGVWLYDPAAHALLPHMANDIRAQTGTQDFVGSAPLNLVYVAHGERMADVTQEERRLYASVDAGFIGQNVYLFCASEGLATVFRAAVDTGKLAETMGLPPRQFVTFAQTVGFAGA